ncbi:MAG: alkaline phosphatase, partial [Prevotellaceae bacterium]|nr:alkaline phosphatase [Prevotellaceae bacterium]
MKHLFLTLALLLAACGGSWAKSIKNKHVILIGLDGWGAYSVPKAHDIPNIRQMMDNGAWTLKKRSVLESSSAINWASMFNGACTEQHGYTQWGSRTPEIPSAALNSHGIFPTIFSVLREQ